MRSAATVALVTLSAGCSASGQTPAAAAKPFELYQGLQDVGVPTRFVVYKGFEGIGHGPSRPK